MAHVVKAMPPASKHENAEFEVVAKEKEMRKSSRLSTIDTIAKHLIDDSMIANDLSEAVDKDGRS